MATLIDQLVHRMGLGDEPSVKAKTTELARMLELRSTNVPLEINDYGKIVLCADIASSILGIPIDKEQALKLSGLRKSHYLKAYNLVEKMLDVNRVVGIRDICVKTGLNDVSKKAEELLELYKKVVASENPDIDVIHPQYAAMAVFKACKLNKLKPPKQKLMPLSHLRPNQWLQLEQRWDKFLAQHYTNVAKETMRDNTEALRCTESKAKGTAKPLKAETEDYEKWKKRMLALAQKKLEEEQLEKENMEVECIIGS